MVINWVTSALSLIDHYCFLVVPGYWTSVILYPCRVCVSVSCAV